MDQLREAVRRPEVRGPDLIPAEADALVEHPQSRGLWVYSVGFGVACLAVPKVALIAILVGVHVAFVVFCCGAAACLFCCLSYSRTERFWYLSVLGVAMALVPPLFY